MTPDPQVLDIAVGSILVFNGLAVFLLWGSVRSRSGIDLPAFAVCWLLYGIRILGPVEAVRNATPIPPVVWDYITFGAYYSQGIAAWFFVEVFWRTKGVFNCFRRIWQFHIIFVIVAMTVDLYNGTPGSMLPYHVNLLLIYILATIANYFTGHIRYERETAPAYIAMVIASVIILHDVFARLGLLPWAILFGPIGNFVLAAAICYALLHRAINNEKRLATIESELNTARQIQHSLLPRQGPSIEPEKLSVRYIPMDAVGGDFYDFIPIDDHRFGVMVADVTGHGIPAALIATMVKTASASQSHAVAEPSRVLAGMNDALYDQTDLHFVTVAYAYIDLEAHELRVASAGHPPPLIYSPTRKAGNEIDINGIALGVLPVQSYETATVPLAPGDRIVIYSDGVTEAAAPDGEEFTSERLLDLLVQRSGTTTDEFADYTLRQLIGWTRKPRLALNDDLTLLVIDVPENGNSAHQTR